MVQWYPIIVNLIIGSLMTLIGFKIYVPPFASDAARDRFYTKWTTLFQVGGLIMTAWAIYRLISMLS